MQTTSSEEKDPLACDSNVDREFRLISDSLRASASAEVKEEPSSSTGFVSQFNAPGGSLENNLDTKACVIPIKLVDMSKLLKHKLTSEEETTNSVSSSNNQEGEKETNSKLSPEGPSFKNIKCEDIRDPESHCFEAFQKTTISKILDCLRVILPVKFDLTKLIPNEKISFLVLRYLKVQNNKEFNDRIQLNLKIIVDTAKIQVTEFGDDLNHPYHNITEEALENALKKCLPQNFSMSDVSNDLLNCLCFIMGQDIFSDGYHILRRQIRKYTREGLIFNEITTQTSECSSLPKPKTEELKTTFYKKKHILVDKPGPINQENAFCDKISKTFSQKNTLNHVESKCKNTTDTSDPKKSKEEESASLPQGIENLESILTYLKNQHCTAVDVLTSFRLMFYLCKFLQVKCDRLNLQKIKSALRNIAEKKISPNGLKTKQKPVARKVLFERPPVLKEKTTDKLKMRPVVILKNLVDHNKDQLVFMNSQKLNNKTEYYSQIVPTLGHSTVKLQRYANDYIQKITNENYKTFRKIIVKKCNNKLVARIKYKTVSPGCAVFVKDYRTASLGWAKGKVLSAVGRFTYAVQLDDGESLECVLDQIRPVPDSETVPVGLRTPRAVKPKQMFDL